MPDFDKFVVKHKKLEKKKETTETITLRIDKDLLRDYDELAHKSDRSRNEVMNMALKFAYEHLKFMDKS
ncbi:CopG family transcriptional regulator [Oscillibacter sp.]|uniref:CopG family transcriptional regulator n=1 Tax=Oscillibacter sp. TaxID=1945593 RepID=UPI00289C778D|nr:CopG family transcriptional regulator [Oscillibacter sp.]